MHDVRHTSWYNPRLPVLTILLLLRVVVRLLYQSAAQLKYLYMVRLLEVLAAQFPAVL